MLLMIHVVVVALALRGAWGVRTGCWLFAVVPATLIVSAEPPIFALFQIEYKTASVISDGI